MDVSVRESFNMSGNGLFRLRYRLIICYVLVILVGDSSIIAQTTISDEAARAAYADCRIVFDEKKFDQCYSACRSLIAQMGRRTRKVQWLLVESGYTAVSNAIDRSFQEQPDTASATLLNYKNLSALHAEIRQLEAMMDTSEQWYSYVRDIGAKVLKEADEYIYQKDRTPEKAVRLLDSLESKFRKRPMWGSGSSVFVFFYVKDSVLTIISEVSKEWRSKRIKDTYYRGELRINLKEVELTKVAINRSKDQISGDYIFTELPNIYRESTYNTSSLPVPALINGKNKSGMSYTLAEGGNEEKAEKKISKATPIPLQAFNLFQFYNELDPRFKEEETDKKIEETFRYLIDYFNK